MRAGPSLACLVECTSGHAAEIALSVAHINRIANGQRNSAAFSYTLKRYTMLKPRTPYSVLGTALAAALFLTAGMAQAQVTAAQADNNSKRCEAANADGSGKAGEFNPDSSSSACSLANGFVNFGARSNDGVGATPEFGTPESDQVLRAPAFSGNSHRLANALGQSADAGYGSSPTLLASTGEHHFGSRDFVYAQEEPAIEGRGYQAGRALASNDVYAPLLTSSGGDVLPPAGGGRGRRRRWRRLRQQRRRIDQSGRQWRRGAGNSCRAGTGDLCHAAGRLGTAELDRTPPASRPGVKKWLLRAIFFVPLAGISAGKPHTARPAGRQ